MNTEFDLKKNNTPKMLENALRSYSESDQEETKQKTYMCNRVTFNYYIDEFWRCYADFPEHREQLIQDFEIFIDATNQRMEWKEIVSRNEQMVFMYCTSAPQLMEVMLKFQPIQIPNGKWSPLPSLIKNQQLCLLQKLIENKTLDIFNCCDKNNPNRDAINYQYWLKFYGANILKLSRLDSREKDNMLNTHEIIEHSLNNYAKIKTIQPEMTL